MKNEIKMNFENFEKISEFQEGNLIGGFSKSYSKDKDGFVVIAADNCRDGNCIAGCGGNNACNTVAGCGA